MAEQWENWSGGLRFEPAAIEKPRGEADIARLVRRATADGRVVRPVGSGHSSAPLVETSDLLVSLERLAGLAAHDPASRRATLRAGTHLGDAGDLLLDAGLGIENLGDVDTQAIAGATATGTHGTGPRFGNLATQVVGLRMVLASGEIVERSIDGDPDFIRAARVSLGALGVITEVTLQCLPAYRLHRKEWCMHIEECLEQLEALMATNRNCDFYWYPRRDEAKVRTHNLTGREDDFKESFEGRQSPEGLEKEEVGWAHRVLASERELRFHEMEYAVEAAAGPACFRAIRQRMKERHRGEVGWRVLYRTVAADDTWISPAFGRETVTISIHQNQPLPYRELFADLEPIFREHGGRPHWAKVHSLSGREFRGLYPRWDDFRRLRDELDPEGRFLNPYLRSLFCQG